MIFKLQSIPAHNIIQLVKGGWKGITFHLPLSPSPPLAPPPDQSCPRQLFFESSLNMGWSIA